MVETFFDLAELELAVAAVRSVSSLPIVGADDLRRRGADAGRRLARSGRPSGCARSGSPRSAPTTAPGRPRRSRALARMQGGDTPLAALPNVGLASMSGQRIVFPHATPEYFGEFAAQARALGARLIGGCCGTTPAQIAAIRAAVDEEPRAAPAPCSSASASRRARSSRAAEETQLQRDAARGRVRRLGAGRPAARRRTPRRCSRPRGRSSDSGKADVRRRQRQPAGAGADERDHGLGRDRALHRRRDDPAPDAARHDDRRPRVAAARRARRRACATSSPSPATRPRRATTRARTAVYEVDSIGLVELMGKLNAGEDWHGRAIDAPTSFFPGVAVNPTADDLELEVDRFHRKVAAGARFAMTQILFDLEPLEAFRERIGGRWPLPVLVGVWPIRTAETLVRVHNETPGIVVPEHVQERYRAGGRRRARGRPPARPRADRGRTRAGARRLRDGAVPAAAERRRAAPTSSPPSSLAARRRRSRPRGARLGEVAADDERRDPVAARCVVARGEHRRTGRPRQSIAGPPELPCRTFPATAVISARPGRCRARPS